jgi:hypothetical protein
MVRIIKDLGASLGFENLRLDQKFKECPELNEHKLCVQG